MVLLGTDTSGDGRQHVVFAQLCGRFQVLTVQYQVDDLPYLHAYRTAVHALGVRTCQTTLSLLLRERHIESQIDLLEIVGPLFGFLLGHRLPGNLGPLFGRESFGHGNIVSIADLLLSLMGVC